MKSTIVDMQKCFHENNRNGTYRCLEPLFIPLKCIEPLSAVPGHGKNTFITHFTRITCRDLQKSYQGIVVMRVCSRFTGDDTSALQACPRE